MIALQRGDVVNGNTVTDVIDHIVYFRCGKCGNPFEHGKARLRNRLPVSCGCEIKSRHDQIMAGCFREHRSGAK
jgi:hypothetical protein